jgi:hypothetical protein
MIRPATRRVLRWIAVSLLFALLAVPGSYNGRLLYAGVSYPRVLALAAAPGLIDLLSFGILALAAAAAALAVVMVRRRH